MRYYWPFYVTKNIYIFFQGIIQKWNIIEYFVLLKIYVYTFSGYNIKVIYYWVFCVVIKVYFCWRYNMKVKYYWVCYATKKDRYFFEGII